MSIESFPVIPVIVIEDSEKAVPLAEALLAGGLRIIEITYRTAAAAESIARIRSRLPEMLVGAGTVVNEEQAKSAIDAGACFGLAPGTDVRVIRVFSSSGIPFVPGVMTPSEVQQAHAAGCSLLKFFPAGAAGGVAMLKALSAPYANLGIRFCPTGGVTVDNMADYLAMESVFAVGGTWLARPTQIAAGDWGAITRQVEVALERARSLS